MRAELIYTIAGAGLAAVAMLAVAWGCFADRARGRRRCPRCWYDMPGAESLIASRQAAQCPECGRTIHRLKDLTRTRRKWKLVVSGLTLGVAASLTWRYPEIADRGWLSLVPTTLLTESLPIVGGNSWAGDELQRRMGTAVWGKTRTYARTLTDNQLSAIVTRIRHGNWLAPPGSEAWTTSYGVPWANLRNRYSVKDGQVKAFNGAPVSGSLAGAIMSMAEFPINVTLRTRSRWPVGAAVYIEAEVPSIWPHGLVDSQTLMWSIDPAQPTRQDDIRGFVLVQIPQTGHVVLTGTLHIYQHPSHKPGSPSVLRNTVPVRLEFDIDGAAEDVLSPVVSPALDQFFAKSAAFRVESGSVTFTPPPGAMNPEYADVAFAGIYEVCDGEHVITWCHFRWLPAAQRWTVGDCFGDQSKEDQALMEGRFDPAWTIRVRSSVEDALKLIDATRYWSGQFEVPIS